MKSLKHFGVHSRDAVWRFAEPVSIWVFTYGRENFSHGTRDPRLVDWLFRLHVRFQYVYFQSSGNTASNPPS